MVYREITVETTNDNNCKKNINISFNSTDLNVACITWVYDTSENGQNYKIGLVGEAKF